MPRAGFGTHKLNKAGNKTRKVEKGNNYIRILPPMHSLVDDPLGWRVYKVTIWGFNGVGAEPGKTKPRPVQTVEIRNKQGMIVQEDPAVTWINKFAEETETYEKAFLKAQTDAGKSEDDADKALKADEEYINRKEWLKKHNIERRWYVNAMFKDGAFGAFKMNHRDHKTGIDTVNAELEKEGVDPLDLDSGVWYNLIRPGNGVIPPDKVDLEYADVEIEVEGKKKKFKERVSAPLTEAQSNQALQDCPDLSTLGGDVITLQQMTALVNSSGDPEEIDAILDNTPTPVSTPIIASLCTLTTGTVSVMPTIIKSVDPAIQARLDAIKAKKAAEEKAASEALQAVAEQKPDEMSDEDFLAKFGS